jgi:hypothetical protein
LPRRCRRLFISGSNLSAAGTFCHQFQPAIPFRSKACLIGSVLDEAARTLLEERDLPRVTLNQLLLCGRTFTTRAAMALGRRCKEKEARSTNKQERRMKTRTPRFDRLVARYYPAVYSFAARLTDDPREAAALTRHAFNSARKQSQSLRNPTTIAVVLISAVLRVGLAPS